MEWFERSIQAGIKDEVKIMAYNKDADLKTRKGFESHFGKFFDEVMDTDECLYAINKTHASSYSTWNVELWLNEYHFGRKLAEALASRITTHDEDKEFTLSDFKDVLSEKFDEFIYNLYDELTMYEDGKEDAICEAVEDMLKY